jgi:putative two-component system response regulator
MPFSLAANSSMYILLLDDSELNNVLMSEALRELGNAQVVSFTEPALALEFARAHAEALGVGVIDYDMPGMNGIAFVQAIKASAGLEHVPMVMVTSADHRRVRREALAVGATDFIGKPFDAVEVRARVANLLVLHRALRSEEDRSGSLSREVAAAVSVIEAREREIVTRLARAAERRDTDTGDHILRVAQYASLIARGRGCDPDYCERLAFASTMHDVGKIAVPDAILLKPGRLTPEERAVMERHAQHGYDILEGSASDVVRLAAEIALSHHERWDGTGYPRQLAGEDIPMSGRIVAVADVFDALVSERPYKRGWPLEEAKAYLAAQAGLQFDPASVAAFLAAWPEVMSIVSTVEAEAA